MKDSIIVELQWRDILKDFSSEEKILAAQTKGAGIYCGFDPTNDSLHLGNLLQIILLKRFAHFGFQAIALLGGGTGMIGDPSGKKQERVLLSEAALTANVLSIGQQLKDLVNEKATEKTQGLDFLKQLQVLNLKDLQELEMILKSINPNKQYEESLRAIYHKLPIPLQELGLNAQEHTLVYGLLGDDKYLKEWQTVLGAPFPTLLTGLEVWKSMWINFSEQIVKVGTTKPIKILNNQDWLGQLSMISFLRDIGKNFNLNSMLAKETVATRLEEGISFTEFSYAILQSYDFLHLYEKENCLLQSGGSDQWGNITSGLELIRKKTQKTDAAGLTIKLLTNANGEKFGKSEKGAVFLSATKTSTYEFYQFLINQEDKELDKLFKALTFLSEDAIKQVLELHKKTPKLRIGQKTLSFVVTLFVHQLKGYFQALKMTDALFNDQIHHLGTEEIKSLLQDSPSISINGDILLIDLLVTHKVCGSKREARQFLKDQAILVNGEKMKSEDFLITKQNAINKQITLLKKGKRHYYIIIHS